ncbi:MAG: trypsin-like serine protease [Chloroflexota bacterium]
MSENQRVMQLLEDISEKVAALRRELGGVEPASSEALLAEMDLETGMMGDVAETAVIPPMTVGEEIVGGEETEAFPDCCAVGNDSGYYCTGTLIAPNLVVTAQHCESATRVFLKGASIHEPENGETIRVDRLCFHPEVDLMVLVLAENATVLPRHVAQGDEVYGAKTAVAAGFGTIDLDGRVGYGLKRQVEVPLISVGCQQTGDDVRYGCTRGREAVAGHRGLRKDSCKGDSGGPLYIKAKDSDDYYLLGATSRGARGGYTTCGDGGIYVRVDLCLDWIREITGAEIEGSRLS